MKSPESNELEALMRAHGPFLHRLARALASDAAAAEDLVNDTWVAALRPGLERFKSERGWLATVLRRRAAAIRAQPSLLPMTNEDGTPGRESSPDEALVRLEREQLVNGALARLPEPYRSVLFLRYHDGLSPTVIARRKGTSHKTVRTQLSRGLEQLRRHLDQEMTRRGSTDPRAQWLGALVPLCATPTSPAAASLAATLAMKKIVLLAVTALLFAAAGIWFIIQLEAPAPGDAAIRSIALDAGNRAARSSEIPGETDALDDAKDPSEALAIVSTGDPDSGARKMLAVSEQQGEEAANEAASSRLAGVTGRVVVLGESPVPPASLDGTLKLHVWVESSGTPISLPVIDGTFRAEFEPGDEGELRLVGSEKSVPENAGFTTFALSEPDIPALGPALRVDEHGDFKGAPDIRFPFGTEDAVIYVRRVPATRLTVVDKATRLELREVQVVVIGLYGGNVQHPAGYRPESLTEDMASPVTLDPPAGYVQRGDITALIGAKGYAWASIDLNLQEGADRQVELERHATLAALVKGELPRGARVRLFAQGDDWRPYSEVPVNLPKEIVWDGLAPGSYSVRLELGEWSKDPKTLAEGQVDLEPDGHGEITLQALSVERAPRAAASGLLIVPMGWSFDALGARVELLGASSDGSDQSAYLQNGDFEPVAGLPGTYAFELPAMEVGPYVFHFGPLAWQSTYDLPEGGVTGLRFEVPEPILISVQVIDADTKQPLPAESLSWHPKWPRDSRGGMLSSAEAPLSTGLFRFHAPRGPIEIGSWGEGLVFATKTIDVQGTEEFFLEARRSARATLSLLDGEAQVPWPDRFEILVEPVGSCKGELCSSGQTIEGRFFEVSEPGRYQIIVPDLNGYHAQPPMEFEMEDGQDTEVVIRLMPK